MATATKLLAQAGYPNGIDVTLDAEGAFSEMAQAIGSLLTKAGIRTKVLGGEGSMIRDKWDPVKPKVGDMRLTSWGNGSLDPEDNFAPTLKTNDRGNSAGYSNGVVDGLLSAASTETNPDKRAEMFRHAQKQVNTDAPWIFLWVPQDIVPAGIEVATVLVQDPADVRLAVDAVRYLAEVAPGGLVAAREAAMRAGQREAGPTQVVSELARVKRDRGDGGDTAPFRLPKRRGAFLSRAELLA